MPPAPTTHLPPPPPFPLPTTTCLPTCRHLHLPPPPRLPFPFPLQFFSLRAFNFPLLPPLLPACTCRLPPAACLPSCYPVAVRACRFVPGYIFHPYILNFFLFLPFSLPAAAFFFCHFCHFIVVASFSCVGIVLVISHEKKF